VGRLGDEVARVGTPKMPSLPSLSPPSVVLAGGFPYCSELVESRGASRELA
jgi:hypothetical protein